MLLHSKIAKNTKQIYPIQIKYSFLLLNALLCNSIEGRVISQPLACWFPQSMLPNLNRSTRIRSRTHNLTSRNPTFGYHEVYEAKSEEFISDEEDSGIEFEEGMDPELILQAEKLDALETRIALEVIGNTYSSDPNVAIRVLEHVVRVTQILAETARTRILDPIYPIQVSLICSKSRSMNITDGRGLDKQAIKRSIVKNASMARSSPRSNCNCAFCLAIFQQDSTAIGIIAALYHAGFGLERDIEFAIELYEYACKSSNNLEIKYEFGVIMLNLADFAPERLSERRKTGEKLIKEAAEGGYVNALRRYAYSLHYLADNQNKDIKLAKEMYFRAILQLDKISMFNYAMLLFQEEKDGVYSVSPAQEDEELGLISKLLSVDFKLLKSKDSSNYKKSITTGWLWIECAASLGLPEAQFHLAKLLASQSQMRSSFEYLKKAANSGHLNAQYNLAVTYYTGLGVERDESIAFTWFLRAAKSGLTEAQFAVGMMYAEGAGIGANVKKAKQFMKKVYRSGDLRALAYLNRFKDP
jgi:TPR repeat protein